MSAYKIEIWADIKFVNCRTSATFDLVDDFGLDEEEAEDIMQRIRDNKTQHDDIEEMFATEARKQVGYDYGYKCIEPTTE